MLMAELMIGRFAQSSPFNAMSQIANRPFSRITGKAIGLCAILTATLICTFYSILSGWFISFSLAPIAKSIGEINSATWLVTFSLSRNLTFTLVFIAIVILLVRQGVQKGIEAWSKRLMPLLLLILIAGSAYILTQPGALTGLKVLLTPDFSKVWHPDILISALGQTFFSLTVGTGAMMVYGSYLDKKENIASLTAYVTLADTLIAFLAALMIIPAMYVAQHNGISIFSTDGSLLKADTLVFDIIPQLFNTLPSNIQNLLTCIFFFLLTIAGLTSAISIVEVPTNFLLENTRLNRQQATNIVGVLIAFLSGIVVFNFNTLFSFMITLTTERAQPLMALSIAIYLGWVWDRNSLLQTISIQNKVHKNTLFWKVWPLYVQYVCPIMIIAIIIQLIR